MNPIDLLVSIPGPDFLWGFAALAAVCIALAYFWPAHDDSTDYPMPSPGDLEPVEIAYLRGGTGAVIQAACFDSWARGQLELVPCTESLTMVKSRGAPVKGCDQVEAALLRATQSERNSHNLLQDRDLHAELDGCLEPVKDKLQGLHLLHSDAARRLASIPFWIALVTLGLVGGAKLMLGIERDKPVFFLILLLVGTWYAWSWTRKRKVRWATRLGQRYLKALEAHYAPLKTQAADGKLPEGVGYGLLPAIFGIGLLSTITAFEPFKTAFTPVHGGWSLGGDGRGDGGSDSGGSDGGGGGCGGGGCGGGGCGGCGGG
jgi:uncharacterized protein (TIGR04222 family)